GVRHGSCNRMRSTRQPDCGDRQRRLDSDLAGDRGAGVSARHTDADLLSRRKHPNALMPGKRPRTTLSPSMAMRGAEPDLAFGTPGGDQQDQWTLQFFLNLIDFGMNLQEAIEAPKFSSAHFPSTFYPHNALPAVVRTEDRIDGEVRSQ